MAQKSSVYERSKKNGGFLSGSRHAFLGTSDGMATGARRRGVREQDDPDVATEDTEDQNASDRNPQMPVKTGEEEDVVGGGEQAAPNYRPAEGMSSCLSCMHFDQTDGECERFEFKAKPDYVCDDFKPIEDTMNSDTTEPSANTGNMPPGIMGMGSSF